MKIRDQKQHQNAKTKDAKCGKRNRREDKKGGQTENSTKCAPAMQNAV
jgi:hypothetical protein